MMRMINAWWWMNEIDDKFMMMNEWNWWWMTETDDE